MVNHIISKCEYADRYGMLQQFMIRETAGLVAKRKEEGCIAVEMELAGRV